jgi:hypothetical protein
MQHAALACTEGIPAGLLHCCFSMHCKRVLVRCTIEACVGVPACKQTSRHDKDVCGSVVAGTVEIQMQAAPRDAAEQV